MLKGGRKLWAPACTGQDLTLQGGDKVKSYLLLATSCDGTLCTTVQFISLRVVCNDTLQGSTGTIKVPHSTQFDATAVKTSLGLGLSHWNEFQAQAKALAQRPAASGPDKTANDNAAAVATALLNVPQGRTPQKPQPRRSPLTNKLGKGNPSLPQ